MLQPATMWVLFPEEMDALRHGNIPQEMEDKWFWYMEDDKDHLNRLLDWWTQPTYDHYGEWLDETISAIQKSR